ncbi:hypothetical protein A4G26_24230 [Mycobacterium kansasii]|nr:hypothetical protein A4G26_24230 [Mycobacterium kansasii]
MARSQQRGGILGRAGGELAFGHAQPTSCSVVLIGDAAEDNDRPGATTFTTGTQAPGESHTTATGSIPVCRATAVAAAATRVGNESVSGTRQDVGVATGIRAALAAGASASRS